MTKEETIEEIKKDIETRRTYLKVLSFFEGRERTRFKDYFRGQLQVLEYYLKKLEQEPEESKHKS